MDKIFEVGEYDRPFLVGFGNDFRLPKFSMLLSMCPGLALGNLVVNSITLISISISILDDAHKERRDSEMLSQSWIR